MGDASEMGDAVLGMVAQEMGSAAPRCLAVRNVSDPEINATGTDPQPASDAGHEYLQSLWPLELCVSAIVCWAVIAALPSGTSSLHARRH